MELTPIRTRIQRLLLDWLPMVVWMLLIFWLSGRPEMPHPFQELRQWDDLVAYAGHGFMFCTLAFLVWRVLRGWPRGAVESRIISLPSATVILSGLYAASDEVHQMSTPGRTASLADWLADMVGIAIAVALLVRARQRAGEGE